MRPMRATRGLVARGVAAKHRRAARGHEKVAQRMMERAVHLAEDGAPERAMHEVREAMLERQFAHLDCERARFEERASERIA